MNEEAGEEQTVEEQDRWDEEPAIPRKYAAAKADGKDLRVRPPKARKTKIKDTKKIGRRQSRIQAQEKRRLALEGRKAGLTYQAIAERVGYASAGGARKAVIKAFAQVIQEPVGDLKTLQVERLNHMLVALWPKVQAGDERAIGTALAVMDKIDRLHGTEAAQTTVVQHSGGVLVAQGNKDDFISAMKQMAGISNNGTNLTAQQVPQGTQGGGSDVPAAIGGPQYPPGMDKRTADSPFVSGMVDIVDAEVVDEVRDIPDVDDVPQKKNYRFGVDPTVKKGERNG